MVWETIAHEKEVGFVLTEIFKVVIVYFRESKNINSGQSFGDKEIENLIACKNILPRENYDEVTLQKNWREEWFLRLNQFSDLDH